MIGVITFLVRALVAVSFGYETSYVFSRMKK